MNEPIVLDEYEAAPPLSLTFEQVAALRMSVGRRLSVTAADTPGDWIIRASSYVGTVSVGGVRILIRPKVSNANLFHLLEAGGNPLEVRPELFDYEQSHDLAPSFATFFARVVENALARGVHRAYEEHEETLGSIRGRVDHSAQQRRLGLAMPVACRFDEHTADVPLNRILKAAAHRLTRLQGVTSSTRLALNTILSRLEEVTPLRGTELRTETAFTRLNSHLRSADRLARMVLHSTSLVEKVGRAEAGVFLVNMNQVFEEFVEARLGAYLAGRLTVSAQQHHWLDTSREVVQLIPDLIFKQSGVPVFVGDTKYKLLREEDRGHNADYYQLLAYTTALAVHEGVLIYCHSDGAQPAPIEVQNSGTRIFVRGINLDGTPADVDAQLLALGEWIAERCQQPITPSLSS